MTEFIFLGELSV